MSSTSTNMVKYTGASNPVIGINNGDSLEIVLNKISAFILNFTERKISLSSPESKEVDIFSAIDVLDKNVSGINSDNINYKGNITFDKGTSSAAVPLLNKVHTFSTSINGTSYIYTFDLSGLKKDIPSTYNLIYVNTRAWSMNSGRNSLIQSNDSISGVIQIPLEKLPVYIETEVRFNTPNGDIILKSTNPITSAIKLTGNTIFEVSDYTTNKETNTSMSGWSEIVTSKILQLDNIRNQIDTFQITGLENISDQQGLFQCIGSLYSFCDSLKKDITSLGTVNLPEIGSCAAKTSGTLQEGIDNLYTAMKEQQSIISTLKQSNDILKSQISGLNSYYSAIVNGPSGGTFNLASVPESNTNCPNGDCGDSVEFKNVTFGAISPVVLTPITMPSFVSSGLVVVNFYTENCNSCSLLDPVIARVFGYYKSVGHKVNIGKINITTYPEIGSTYSIVGTPTLLVFKNGVKVSEIVGSQDFDYIKSKINLFL